VVVDVRTGRFEGLYARHYRAVYAYVYRRLAPRVSDVGDVTAEVFAVAWRRLDDIPGGDEELLWLYGVAYRCVGRARRTDWRRLRLIRRLSDEARVHATAGDASSREKLVLEAIQRLRPRDREVLRLVMWEGLTHAQASVALGCSPNAVAQRLHTARDRLRSELVEHGGVAAEITMGN
jgi:RNA polymerase sigma-70 factor (ECF subfamily)